MTEKELWEREARNHAELADEYAELSHDYEGDLADEYSAASEAHAGLSKAFAKKAGHPAEWGWA